MSRRPLPAPAPAVPSRRAALALGVTALGGVACLASAVVLGSQVVTAAATGVGGSPTLPDILVAAVETCLALAVGAFLARTAGDVWRAWRTSRADGPSGRSGPAAEHLLPVRRARIVAVLLGVSLGGTTLQATAAPLPPTSSVAPAAPTSPTASSGQPDGLADLPAGPVPPELVPTSTAPHPSTAGRAAPVDPELRPLRQEREVIRTAEVRHVVMRGDTLWAIAQQHLPPDADAETVAQTCRAWHDHNRDVIGPDPDLILPGQVLTAPAATQLQGNP